MKLSGNQKIVLGLAIGGGLAWLFLGNQSKVKMKSDSSNQDNMINLAKTREEKIEYILDNLEANDTELKSGFSGDRFVFDPTIGYAIPVGYVDVQSAGDEMILPRNVNYANEVFFAADGESTNNPIDEAKAILNGLDDRDLNFVYICVLKRKNNPNVKFNEILSSMNIQYEEKDEIKKSVNKILNDIKSLKEMSLKSSFLGRLFRSNPCGTRPIFNRQRREEWMRCMKQRNPEALETRRPRVINNIRGVDSREKRRNQMQACGTRPLFARRRQEWDACVSQLDL